MNMLTKSENLPVIIVVFRSKNTYGTLIECFASLKSHHNGKN